MASIYGIDPQSKCSGHLSKVCRKECMKGSFRKGMMRSKKRCNTCVEAKRINNRNCNSKRAEEFKKSVGIDQMRSGTLMENLGKKFGSKEEQKIEYSDIETYDPPTLGEYIPKKEEYIPPSNLSEESKKRANINAIAAMDNENIIHEMGATMPRGVMSRDVMPVMSNREKIDPTLFTGTGMKGLGSWNGGGKKRRKKQTKRRRKKSKRTKRTKRTRRIRRR